MNLSALLAAFRALPEYPNLLQRAGRDSLALGLPRAARLPLVAALATDLNRPALLITARSDRALLFNEELLAWLRPVNSEQWPVASDPPSTYFFPEPNPLPYEHAPWGPRTIRQRIATLAALTTDHRSLFTITSARALLTRTLPRRDFTAATRPLRAGQSVRLDKLLENWAGAGYTGETIVVEPGQFSRRGGIVDVWPPADSLPTRIELFGDEVEHLRHFDPATQRSGENVDAVIVSPAREALPKNGPPLSGLAANPESDLAADFERLAQGVAFPAIEYYLPLLHTASASLFDYLPDNTLVFVDDWSALADTVNELETQALELRADAIDSGLITRDFPAPNLSWSDLQDDLTRLPLIHLGRLEDEVATADSVSLGDHFSPGPRFGGQVKQVLDHLQSTIGNQQSAIVVTRQAARLAELWNEHNEPLVPVEDLTELAPVTFVQGTLADGFTLQLPTSNFQLLTDSEIFGWARPEPRRRRTATERAETPEAAYAYADFNPGDFVVHIDYGIGRYLGLVKRSIENSEREYIHLQYDGGDDLFVPIIQADRLTKYIGSDESEPALSRLGTSEWINTRTRAQQAAEQVASELLELYAKRELAPGRAFSADNNWQKELEASFGYIETDDQLKAIAAVKTDMERPRPMDRLICGDVGYGKTEVALRAAFKAVNDGTQVAVLVPTTVLAQQHYNTFAQRLAAYPVKVEMLSRFRSHAEQEKIIEGLAVGQVDIVIGTHRLISKDVQFKDMGLLVIDEEQRFGVTHKERLKQMRTEVDVLTLTATPIPRTLYMSLAGLRDISMINTPPDERLPIITHVGPYNERAVRQAILRELDRGGQIFFVHNRVQSINIVKHKLEKLVPEARLGVGHGQMNEHELERAMTAFTQDEIDVLLCTSIIESGLDIPNANTLIVDRADTFGLAQLYQLRGRVGRGANRAYAYFFHDKHHRMTPEGRQRLETIAEQTELGAGYSIAMRDLEMRGAGDILGPRQHGQIAAVGFHLYTRLLAQAVKQLKAGGRANGRDKPLDFDLSLTTVDLPLPASIPSDYVPDRSLRLKLYRRLAEIKDEAGLDEIAAELADRFGQPPRPVESLLFLIRVKLLAYKAGIEGVASEDGQIVLRSRLWESDEGRASVSGALGPGTRMSKGKAWLPRASDEARNREAWREQLVSALESLGKVFVEG
ncbi:MAG: transcription-repair coupling factor [Chloroflexi bacterium]|nr:transcription-repair coupling factor [Chloroflexota bacterium]